MLVSEQTSICFAFVCSSFRPARAPLVDVHAAPCFAETTSLSDCARAVGGGRKSRGQTCSGGLVPGGHRFTGRRGPCGCVVSGTSCRPAVADHTAAWRVCARVAPGSASVLADRLPWQCRGSLHCLDTQGVFVSRRVSFRSWHPHAVQAGTLHCFGGPQCSARPCQCQSCAVTRCLP